MTVSATSAELLIFLQPNFIGWCNIMSWSVLCKNYSCFQGQGHSEGWKVYWIFIYVISSVPLISWQSRCTDFLLIITEQSTTKWAYTDSSTLTYTITRDTKWVGVGCTRLSCSLWRLLSCHINVPRGTAGSAAQWQASGFHVNSPWALVSSVAGIDRCFITWASARLFVVVFNSCWVLWVGLWVIHLRRLAYFSLFPLL